MIVDGKQRSWRVKCKLNSNSTIFGEASYERYMEQT